VAHKGKRYFGNVRQRGSGRFQARYTGPDGRTYTAPVTFDTKGDAEAWLSLRHSEMLRGAWLPPAAPQAPQAAPVTLANYAAAWLAGRDLADRTREDYTQVLRDHILPAFGGVPVTAITPAAVREWHAALKGSTGPTMRAHAYGLLRTIMNTAVADELIPANPCRVRGGGQVKRAKTIRPATLAELETLVKVLPDRYRLMALLAAWCALRFGELAELRRSDIDVRNGIVHVRRGVVRVNGGRRVKGPKSEAGRRDVAIPPHLIPAVKDHLRDHVPASRDALMFPAASGGHMAPATLYRVYYPAREAAGRPDLRFHDLRHTGAVLAAATGATLAELMARLGHSTAGAALRYQHAAAERDKVIAQALSHLAGATVTPIARARAKASRHMAAK
jgi:integrase